MIRNKRSLKLPTDFQVLRYQRLGNSKGFHVISSLFKILAQELQKTQPSGVIFYGLRKFPGTIKLVLVFFEVPVQKSKKVS